MSKDNKPSYEVVLRFKADHTGSARMEAMFLAEKLSEGEVVSMRHVETNGVSGRKRACQ